MANVTFDGTNKLISVNAGIDEINVQIDLYSEWKDWAIINLNYYAAMRSTGGDPLPGGEELGSTYFLINDWKIYVDHSVNFTGNLYTDDGSSPFSPAPGVVIVTSTVSTLVEKPSLDVGNAAIFV